jgi:endonuclease/exonuclease/phosphatase family metal-dependent hydrolase
MKFVNSLLFLVNIAFALLLLISYLSPYISPEANGFIPLLGLVYPALFSINIAFFVFWIFTKWTYGLLSLCALLIGFSATQRFISFNSPKVIKSENLINVASYNVAKGTSMGKDKYQDFYDLITTDFKSSVVFLQESSSKINDVLKQKLGNDRVVNIPQKGATIISSHKILKTGSLNFKNQYNTCVWADILFNGQKIRLYSVHLQSNNVTRIAENVRNEGEIVKRKTLGRVAKMMQRYNESSKKRLEQVNTLLEDAKKIDYPIIIGGDFNDVPQSYVYAQLTDQFTDTFMKRGNGMGTSFNGAIPSLRIDYFFVSDHFSVLDFETRKEEYSDHYPITTRLLLKK